LKPIEQQKEWVLDEAKAMQLKPIVEGDNPYSMFGAFYDSQITEAKLSSWENINATKSCDYMFAQSKQLTDVDLSGLRELKNCASMFEGCTAIKRINFDSVKAITGGLYSVQAMLKGCSSLNGGVLSFPNLVSIAAGVGREMWAGVTLKLLYVPNLKTMGQDGWYGRGDALEVYAPNFITNDVQNIDLAHTKCVRLTINVKALNSPSNNRSAICNITNLEDLFIIGYPDNSIYLKWQGSLNFNSVCGVLRKLCENTKASGLVCAFKANFNIDDKTEWTYTDGDGNTEVISNPNGILKGLREQAILQGWDIKNLTINPVE
jgi:hypothetical protein